MNISLASPKPTFKLSNPLRHTICRQVVCGNNRCRVRRIMLQSFDKFRHYIPKPFYRMGKDVLCNNLQTGNRFLKYWKPRNKICRLTYAAFADKLNSFANSV